ncbi:MAG: peptidoglycan-binding protein [Minisyncoccota bacterium]
MRTNKNISSVLAATLFTAAAFFAPAVSYAADALTAAPASAGMDNLIGATNTQWVFTATTTNPIGRGNVVQFAVPSVNQAQPFSIGNAVLLATTSISLYPSAVSTTTMPGVGVANGPSGSLIYGFATSTVPAGTVFSVTLGGINNGAGQLSSMGNLAWNVRAGTTTDPTQPGGNLSATAFNATSTVSLMRAGGALVSDVNSKITPSTTAVGATNVSYTFSITTATQIPIGGKVIINFPSEYNLSGATTTSVQNISNHTSAQVAAGAIATSTSPGVNRVILTVSNAVVNAGDVLTVTVNGLTNPATAGVYRPFGIFTTKSNNGLIDGSYFGFEQSDYGNGAPPPNDTVYIGGDNTLVVQVLKSNGSGGTVPLTAGDIAQVKVGVGCPDKQYFMGLQWLDSNGIARYPNILDCNYMTGVDPFNQGSSTFYSSFLPPGMKSINLVSSGGVGQTATTTLVFGVPNATTTVALTGGVSGKNAFINAYSADNQSFTNVYTSTSYTTLGFDGSGHGYAQIPINSGEEWNFSVQGGTFGSGANFTDGSGNEYWAPVLPSINLTSGTTTPINLGTFAYVLASDTLNVSLVDTSGSPITNACVGVSRSGGGVFMGPQDMICSPNSGNNYQFKVPPGAVTIQVSRNGFGAPTEYAVAISAATTNKTITLSAPTSYISVTVQASGGTAINGAPVFASGSNGFGNAMTGTNGTTKIYVQPGTYSVQGFAPAFGQLTAQTVTVTNSSNPSVTFTVNTGSLKTISGTITQGGTGVAGINIGAHGTGSTTGGNGTQTDASGNYTLYVPAGTYEVEGWSQGTGGLSPQTVDVSSGNASGVNWALGAQGTLHITLQNASTISQLFAGAFNSTTGIGNETNAWTTSGTSEVADIPLPAGTYNVQSGSPSLGQFGSQTGVVINGGGTTNVTFNAQASSTLVTLSGSTGVANVNVWASRINGQGFFSTQTDSSGNYALQVPDATTYHVGVRSLAYIAAEGDVDVVVSGNTTRNFTLVAASATITGKVLDSNGNGIANGWVTALKTGVASSTQIGAPTDAGGNYTLNVDPSSTWSLTAQGPCYLQSSGVAASAGDTGKNITLSAQGGCGAQTPDVHAVTDSSGGQISRSDMTLNIPANALGTSQNSVNVSVSSASDVVPSANATPLTGSVKDITATNSSGQSITSLNTDASLTITYDPSQLPVGFDASKLQLGYFDTTTGQWEPVAATVDTTNHTLTAQVSHFTEYGPILPGVPSAPTDLSATAASVSQINLSWTASPTATSYTIYRSATNSNFTTPIATGVTGTSYSDTSLSASTAYYYEVAGVNSNGEGLNSSSANTTTNAVASSGGGNGSISIPVISSPASQTASVPSAQATSTATTAIAMTPATQPPPSVMPILKRSLGLGSQGEDVIALQAFLEARGYLVMPPGTAKGYFGALTSAAVKRFQKAKDIDPIGVVGPLTITAIGKDTSAQVSSQTTLTSSTGGTYVFAHLLTMGGRTSDVKNLQIVLNSDPDTQIAQTGDGSPGHETGYFGALTKAAVEKFQVKYGIAAPGEDGYSIVGPKTRAKLETILVP